jgi:hypothetical protein
MNSKVVYAALFALTLLIVLPVLTGVNATSPLHADGHSALVAAGSPGPPPVPNPWLQPEPELVAAGSPGPPPVPNPWLQEPELVAAGSPGPPPVPNPWLLPESNLVGV